MFSFFNKRNYPFNFDWSEYIIPLTTDDSDDWQPSVGVNCDKKINKKRQVNDNGLLHISYEVQLVTNEKLPFKENDRVTFQGKKYHIVAVEEVVEDDYKDVLALYPSAKTYRETIITLE